MIVIVTEYFVSVPGTEDIVRDTVETFKHFGWGLVSVEDIGKKNIRYTVGWPEHKGEPNYPPNIQIENK